MSSAAVILALFVNQLELSVFAQNAGKTSDSIPSSTAVQVRTANSPLMPPSFQATHRHNLAAPQSRPISVGAALQGPKTLAQAPKKRNGVKWVILVAAAGAGIAALTLTKGNSSPPISAPTPTVTVGQPVVEQPGSSEGYWD